METATVRRATQPRDTEGLFVLSFVIGAFALIVAVAAFLISFGDDDGGAAVGEQVVDVRQSGSRTDPARSGR